MNRYQMSSIDGVITPKILRSGFAFALFGERYLEGLETDDYADLILRGAAIFPLLDIFVRQVSNMPINEINYKSQFETWFQDCGASFYQQFDLTSEINGNESKGEQITRELIERILGKPFIKERPEWLRESNRSRCLELDGYNQDLNIAFEYQGEQHYSFIPLFHQKIDDFEKQQRRDNLKAEICAQREVKLIQVPYTRRGDRQFIIDELRKFGVTC